MSTSLNSTITPRTVYESPCGRVRIVRDGPRDFALYLDDRYTKSYPFSFQAEHEGGLWLHEQSLELAAQLADEAAMRDAASAGVLDLDILPPLLAAACPCLA